MTWLLRMRRAVKAEREGAWLGGLACSGSGIRSRHIDNQLPLLAVRVTRSDLPVDGRRLDAPVQLEAFASGVGCLPRTCPWRTASCRYPIGSWVGAQFRIRKNV